MPEEDKKSSASVNVNSFAATIEKVLTLISKHSKQHSSTVGTILQRSEYCQK